MIDHDDTGPARAGLRRALCAIAPAAAAPAAADTLADADASWLVTGPT